MNNLPKILESKAKIRFQDCDPFNHLNNSKYIDYFVNAREDQILENYQFDIFHLAKEKGLAWVFSTNQIAYIRPVFTMEEVIIESQLIAFSNRHLVVEARMWDHTKASLKAFSWMSFVHFNLQTGKPEVHQESYMNLFEAVYEPIEHPHFAEREQFLRKQTKR